MRKFRTSTTFPFRREANKRKKTMSREIRDTENTKQE
jgi:hypothetical protein